MPLAGDARALQRNREGMYDGVPPSVPDSFDRKEFEELVLGRDTGWLMAASKMADLRARRSTRERLIGSIVEHDVPGKLTYTKEYVSSVLEEMERAGLVTTY